MKEKLDKAVEDIKAILPEHPHSMMLGAEDYLDAAVEESADKLVKSELSKDIAKAKLKEKLRIKRLQQREEAGVLPGRTVNQQKALDEQQKIIEAHEESMNQLEAIYEVESRSGQAIRDMVTAGSSRVPSKAMRNFLDTQGTTRPEVVKLLHSLNINLNLQLTKNDTANLLACILTCNESQLKALMDNKRLPLAIKAIIKRIVEDAKLGNIETIEKLWDRIFGKVGLTPEVSSQVQQDNSIIPQMPISREAYIILRDTLIK